MCACVCRGGRLQSGQLTLWPDGQCVYCYCRSDKQTLLALLMDLVPYIKVSWLKTSWYFESHSDWSINLWKVFLFKLEQLIKILSVESFEVLNSFEFERSFLIGSKRIIRFGFRSVSIYKLNAQIKFEAINTLQIPRITYSFNVIKWNLQQV